MREESEARLFNKIDDMAKDLNEMKISIAKLPCDVRHIELTNFSSQLKRIWWVMGMVLAAIISLGITNLK